MNAEKIKQIRKELQLTQAQLAQLIGVSRNTIINYENGGVIPESKVVLLKTMNKTNKAQYSTFDQDNEPQNIVAENAISLIPAMKAKSEVHVPYHNVDFAGGWSSEQMFSDRQPDFYINNPEFDRCDFACNLVGKSISKVIPDGSIVGFRIVDDWQIYFPQNELYGIITKNDFRTVKLISKTRDGSTLILKPLPSAEFSDRYKDQEEPVPVQFVTRFLQVIAYACFERLAM
ncbi:helix-turn-helix transcriptional regulator [Chryseobacterium sp. R2A-55]|uniref:helix-turn-helix transcriptional regulator n=1 Tax=Chryseobacterium sp. R2A-55 TaxID=2744445 RepID=UPI001F1F00B7|nr:helix-turn-helix transcriptional regulator [Chryseobacterium sp. R2A-55]